MGKQMGYDEQASWLLPEDMEMSLNSRYRPATPLPVAYPDLAQRELVCARQFNQELPGDPHQAVLWMETLVKELTGTRTAMILLFNETSGTYTCLHDTCAPLAQPRELTLVADRFLQELLQSDQVLHTFLYREDPITKAPDLLGIVAIADKGDGTGFDLQDDLTLELVARYLGPKVQAFQSLQHSQTLPYIQSVVLEVSNRLIAACDQESIWTGVLEALQHRLDVSVCQYIALTHETGQGQILYEAGRSKKDGARRRPAHPPIVQEFASLISLLTSVARRTPYLQFNGPMLGDKALSDWFHVPQVESALVVPVTDGATGHLWGVLTLLKTEPGRISPNTVEIAKQVSVLVSVALGRTLTFEKAVAMATSDELTGLTNRRGFYDRFEIEIERARRNMSSLCVAMIDVDHFKSLNDTYGHLSGDLVLQHLASLLMNNVRKSDLVCRFGGEEFALLLPDTSEKSAYELLDRIRRKVQRSKPTGSQGEALKLTLSAGVSSVNTQQGLSRSSKEVLDEALATADEQLYAAKTGGRNQVRAAHYQPTQPDPGQLPLFLTQSDSF
jgi:diguanylate cyclase (GGDEF)-like protein